MVGVMADCLAAPKVELMAENLAVNWAVPMAVNWAVNLVG